MYNQSVDSSFEQKGKKGIYAGDVGGRIHN
jgi:hypothetical protein